MTYGIYANKYFIQAEVGMDPANVIGGPVFNSNDSEEVVGRILDYIPNIGMLKIELITPMHYKNLIKAGVPINQIIFNYTA